MAKKKSKKTTSKTVAPDRRLLERTWLQLDKLVGDREFSSTEEANQFIERALAATGGQLPEFEPLTPAEQALELVYEALESGGRKRIALATRAISIDPDCADAYILLAEAAVKDLNATRELYHRALDAAERILGPKYFVEQVGIFWGLVETRPYMRARAGLAHTLWELEEHDAAVGHFCEILRLNPSDNLGVRYSLLPHLITLGRYEEAEELLGRYPDDPMAVIAYMRALLTFCRQGDTALARTQLRQALEQNRFVPDIMIAPSLPPEPDFYGLGDRNEAIMAVRETAEAWEKAPGGLEWFAHNVVRMLPEFGKRAAALARGPFGIRLH